MANIFNTYQVYAPQVTADPFHTHRLFSKQLEMVKVFWKGIICADSFRAARWHQGGLTYMLYHSTRDADAFVIGVIGSDGLPLSHHSYQKDEVGTGRYYADILSNLPYARKDRILEVTVVHS